MIVVKLVTAAAMHACHLYTVFLHILNVDWVDGYIWFPYIHGKCYNSNSSHKCIINYKVRNLFFQIGRKVRNKNKFPINLFTKISPVQQTAALMQNVLFWLASAFSRRANGSCFTCTAHVHFKWWRDTLNCNTQNISSHLRRNCSYTNYMSLISILCSNILKIDKWQKLICSLSNL